jgi:hypothetical protein
MSDKVEMWSRPWHALQRSLAAKFAAEAAAGTFANRSLREPPVPLVSAGSWLVRAHGAVARGQ